MQPDLARIRNAKTTNLPLEGLQEKLIPQPPNFTSRHVVCDAHHTAYKRCL